MSNILLNNSKILLHNNRALVTFKNLANATNLKAWYAARLEPVVADGSAMASMFDFSGNLTALAQGTAGNRPLYKTNIINGLPAFLFDGTNDRMNFTSNALTQNKTGLTSYIVWKRVAGTGANQGLFSFFNNAGSARHSMFINTGTSFNEMFVAGKRVTETAAIASTAHLDTSFHVGVNVTNYAGDLLSLYLDGYLRQSAVIGGTSGANSQNAVSSATDTLAHGTSFLNGYICEYIFCDAAHTGEEVTDIMTTLQRIYGGLPQ